MPPRAAKAIKESLGFVKELSNRLRTISHLLHPPLPNAGGAAEGTAATHRLERRKTLATDIASANRFII